MERGLLRKVTLSKYKVLEKSALSHAIQKTWIFIRISFVTIRLEFSSSNNRKMTVTDKVYIIGDGLIAGHTYLFCTNNLTQIFWIEGTTTLSTDVNHIFF